ncbi:hypothetical protein Tco_0830040, partial [Tanacetum coccineum]
EPRTQTAAAVDVPTTTDRNCIPISRVFDRFRNMPATSHRAEYMSQTVEPRIQTTAAVHGHNTADRNCVPISKVFDRFRNMRVTNDRAECIAQTASCSRLLAAVGNRDRSSVYTPVVPVPKLSKATLARLGSNNARNNLQHTGDVLMHFFSFYLLL